MAFPTSPTAGERHGKYQYNTDANLWEFVGEEQADSLAAASIQVSTHSWSGTSWQHFGQTVNGGNAGGGFLVLASVNTSAGNATSTAMYLVRQGYDGNNFSAHYIGGNSDFLSIRANGANLEFYGPGGNKTIRIFHWG